MKVLTQEGLAYLWQQIQDKLNELEARIAALEPQQPTPQEEE